MGGQGSGGHNRKSIEEHKRNGTYKPSRHGALPGALKAVKEKVAKLPKPERAPKQGIPPCPDSLDEVGREEWTRVCEQLDEKGLLVSTFVSAIEGYCEAYSRWRRAIKELESGFVYDFMNVKTLKMKRRQKPEVIIAKDALNQMKAFLNDLGLTPKNLVVTQPKDDRSELDKFLDKQARRLDQKA